MKRCALFVSIFFISALCLADTIPEVSTEWKEGMFTLSSSGRYAPLFISSEDWPGVIRAFTDLQTDIGRVTGNTPMLATKKIPRNKEVVVAGTIGKSPVIDELIRKGKLNTERHCRQMGMLFDPNG